MKRTLSIFIALHAVDIAAALWGMYPDAGAPVFAALLITKTACLLCAGHMAHKYRVQQITARVNA